MKEAQLRWLSFSETQPEIRNCKRKKRKLEVEGPQATNEEKNKPGKERFNSIY
jgi:hypothetical protein